MWSSSLLLLISSLLVLTSAQDGATYCAYTASLKRSDCRPVLGVDFRFTVIPNDLPADVEIILMSDNPITSLSPGNLTFYKNLTTLHLNDTLLTSLPADLETTDSTIQSLFLDGSLVEEIDNLAFQFFPNIKILSLRNTKLTTIRSEMFTGLNAIEELYLDDSPLSSLPGHVFNGINHIKKISLTNTNLMTIGDDVFDGLPIGSSELNVYLSNNPWSCDCNLRLFRIQLSATPSFPADRSTLRCRWPTTDLMTDLTFIEFSCSVPNVTVSPQTDSILTDRTYTLTCTVTGSPFPEVTWLKDGVTIDYTDRVYLQSFDASLYFSNIELSDEGVYQCIVENSEGSDNSTVANITVQEATCFDDTLSSHETDVDCGGIYCKQCLQNQRCLVDSDCSGSLVCLYTHSLPSLLHYISPNNVMAYKCDLPHVPRQLLNDRILDVMASINVNFTVEVNITDVQNTMTTLLAEQLSIPVATFDNVRVTTVERTSAQSVPLVQIWFNLFKNTNGHKGRSNLLTQIDDGRMKGTVKITETNAFFSIRINL